MVARSVAGENLLVPVHGCTRSVYTLNATGCVLWDLLEREQTEETLIQALVEQYQIAKGAAQRDVSAFLLELVRMELVVSV